MNRKFILNLKQRGVGDTLITTAFARDFKAQYPDAQLKVVGTASDEIFANNDDVYKGETDDSWETLEINYKECIDNAWLTGKGKYIHAPYFAFCKLTCIPVKIWTEHPIIHLSQEEKKRPLGDLRYGVIAAGSKTDMPAKQWPFDYWQELVDATDDTKWVQVGGNDNIHVNPKLNNVIDMVGKTTLRQLFTYIYQCDQFVGHISMPMLVAMTFNLPGVVICGGREPAWLYDKYKEYTRLEFLSSIGRGLDCCKRTGCSVRGVKQPHNETEPAKGYYCSLPVGAGDKIGPKCMYDIQPIHVIEELRTNKG